MHGMAVKGIFQDPPETGLSHPTTTRSTTSKVKHIEQDRHQVNVGMEIDEISDVNFYGKSPAADCALF
jgi:hypothetical protein